MKWNENGDPTDLEAASHDALVVLENIYSNRFYIECEGGLERIHHCIKYLRYFLPEVSTERHENGTYK